ncbi:MAG: TetR family transcriptional regulator [Mycobacterium kyogaense]|uniref:TetR family transcriptional regulator n=1 Tax=Mycobacterium kyogaense TaxID=2212479 RepID=UPI002FF4C930
MAGRSSLEISVRQAAVERVLGGQRASAVAKELGVHSSTVHRWVNSASVRGTDSAPTDLRLMIATQELLREQDYSQITVEAVARHCGVALRTAFHHFDSKRELFRAAIDNTATVLVGAMAREYEAAPWPDEPLLQLRIFLRRSAEAIYATPSAHVLFRDLGVPRSDSFALRWHDTFEQAVAQILERCAAVESIDPDTDVPAAAHAITGAMRGIHAAVFDGGDPAQALRIVDRLHLTVSAD